MENRGGVGWGCSTFLVCVHPPVFKVRLAPPPLPPAGLLSLPAAPVWTSALPPGEQTDCPGPEQHQLQEHSACCPTHKLAWPPGWCAGFQALESGFVGRVPGDWKAGKRLHGLHIPHDKKMRCLFFLSRGCLCFLLWKLE